MAAEALDGRHYNESQFDADEIFLRYVSDLIFRMTASGHSRRFGSVRGSLLSGSRLRTVRDGSNPDVLLLVAVTLISAGALQALTTDLSAITTKPLDKRRRA